MVSLDEPHTSKRYAFTSLNSLFAFLLQQAQDASRQAPPQAGSDNNP
jgi:hypothetical protein